MPKNIVIKYKDLKKGSDYALIVEPHLSNMAANTIKSAWKKHQARKQGKDVEEDIKIKVIREMLLEPVDADFQNHLAQCINENHFEKINFNKEDFTGHLFAALRAELIDKESFLTVKLMYESLIWVHDGQIPPKTDDFFSRYNPGEGPYQPSSITYWNAENEAEWQDAVSNAPDKEKIHYYTFKLSKDQCSYLLYYFLNNTNTDLTSKWIKIFYVYFQKQKSNNPDFTNLLTTLEKLSSSYSGSNSIHLRKDILKWLCNFEPNIPEIKLSNKARESISFLVNLEAVECQIPGLCLAQNTQAEESEALLNFVVPTIAYFNTLQHCAHGEESTDIVPILGAETIGIVRAYDDIPIALKKGESRSTFMNNKLSTVYHTATLLNTPSRPVEVTYKDVPKTIKPHGANCYDFLLTWHDMFHAWRNGSNFKRLIRLFRQVHDSKAGLTNHPRHMPKAVADLVDLDSSVGALIRIKNLDKQVGNEEDKLYLRAALLITLFNDAGFNFDSETDDNFLLLDDIAREPKKWRYLNLQFDELTPIQNATGITITHFNQLIQVYQTIRKYRSQHPDAHIVTVILSQLLSPTSPADEKLLSQIELEKVFYWSANSGIIFKKEWRPLLNSIGIKNTLRKNSATMIRLALSLVTTPVLRDNLEKIGQELGDSRKGDVNAKKNVKIKTIGNMKNLIEALKKDINTENSLQHYQDLYTRYSIVFNLIKENPNQLYTRKNKPWFFQTNKETRHMTDTQLMHLSFVKQLFIKDIQKLTENCSKEDKDKIQEHLTATEHFINFNRTRFNLTFFKKDKTTSHDLLEKILNTPKK